jgi:hypothetical protein
MGEVEVPRGGPPERVPLRASSYLLRPAADVNVLQLGNPRSSWPYRGQNRRQLVDVIGI